MSFLCTDCWHIVEDGSKKCPSCGRVFIEGGEPESAPESEYKYRARPASDYISKYAPEPAMEEREEYYESEPEGNHEYKARHATDYKAEYVPGPKPESGVDEEYSGAETAIAPMKKNKISGAVGSVKNVVTNMAADKQLRRDVGLFVSGTIREMTEDKIGKKNYQLAESIVKAVGRNIKKGGDGKR